MSESAPEPPAIGSGNNPLTRKFAGIPGWVILAGVAVIAYWYFSHKSAASTAAGIKTTGGGGSASTGKTVVRKGAVTINVKQTPGDGGGGDDKDDDDDNPQPGHHPKPRKKKQSVNPYDVPHDPRRVTSGQAEYAIKHNRPVYEKGGSHPYHGWTKVSRTSSGTQYWVGSEVYDWLRDAGQIKGANQGA